MMLTNSPIVKQWFKRVFITTAVLAVGLTLSVFVITPPPAATQSIAVVVDQESGLQRSFEAEAARYTAMAKYYTAHKNLQRSFEADAARYTAMANHYAAAGTNVETLRYQGLADFYTAPQRAFKADAARYTAMAAHYADQEDHVQRGFEASAARYTAMADYYATADTNAETLRYQGLADFYSAPQRALKADAARYTAMADYYLR